ncbi:MAG: hypothetical protein COA78_34715 [Blastopirellula sp.]|nr:MAG: hypothetical protein COA78_34715 [Blastopirellula sp.]
MQIDLTGKLTPTEIETITRQATAAGFDSVEHYVEAVVHSLAAEAEQEAKSPPLSEEDLKQSLAECDAAMDDIKHGRVYSEEEAFKKIEKSLGYKIE